MKFRTPSGFSLLELLVVLVIVGIVLAIGVPGINRARADAELESIRARAVSVQTAKLSFVDAVGSSTANTAWKGNSKDSYNLLRQYLPTTYPADVDPTADDNPLFPSPFKIDLGTLYSDPVTLTGPDSANPGTTVNIPLQKY